MALDSLLARKKNEVSEVSQVQASNDGACGRYPIELAEVSQVSVQSEIDNLDTPDTSCNPIEVSREPLQILACTLDTPDTCTNAVTADDVVLSEPSGREVFEELAADQLSDDADDRITCRKCASYTRHGVCSVASPGGTVSASCRVSTGRA